MKQRLAWNSGKPYVPSYRPVSIFWHTLLATVSHQTPLHRTSLPLVLCVGNKIRKFTFRAHRCVGNCRDSWSVRSAIGVAFAETSPRLEWSLKRVRHMVFNSVTKRWHQNQNSKWKRNFNQNSNGNSKLRWKFVKKKIKKIKRFRWRKILLEVWRHFFDFFRIFLCENGLEWSFWSVDW